MRLGCDLIFEICVEMELFAPVVVLLVFVGAEDGTGGFFW